MTVINFRGDYTGLNRAHEKGAGADEQKATVCGMTSLKGFVAPVIVHLGRSISYRYAERSQKQPDA